jgi:beta-1,4-N-acetylglucosaminyltransferase
MDHLAVKIDEKIIMQIGSTKYKPVNATYFDFAEYSKIQNLTQHARVIISHAGVGSILTSLEQKTHIIIVPRLKKYDEASNDHQLEIAKKLLENPNITVLFDVKDIKDSLKSKYCFLEETNKNKLVYSLKKYLYSISR